MKSFDMFSGYGGFAIAGERCGIKTIGFSEIDKYASMVLKYRFKGVRNYGDCTRIDWRSVPDFDLLNGGSPCQSFSIAGKRKGLAGASGLVWEYLRCLREKQPRYFIWENVKGALSSRRGLDFANILAAFSEQGYSLWWQVLNAKDFGVPQNRERVFVIGSRNGSPREVFFERKDNKKNIEGDYAVCVDGANTGGIIVHNMQPRSADRPSLKYSSGGSGHLTREDGLTYSGRTLIQQLNSPTHSNNRIYGDKGLSPALNTAQGGNRQPKIVQGRTPLKFIARNQAVVSNAIDANYGKGDNRPGNKTVDTGNTNAVEVYDDYNSKFRTDGLVGSITTNIGNQAPRNGNKLFINTRIRRLTPREAERLMGLEDDWLRWGINDKGKKVEISDSQRYKMAGNGVVAPVVEHLMREMF